MNDATDTPHQAAPQRSGRRRLLYALPVVLFAVLAVALAVALQRDPSLVPSPLVGKTAPETVLPEVPGFGPAFDSADFDGQVTLVNVFASWCLSCRDEHPLLLRLAEQHDIPIFGLAYKDKPEDAAAWLADYGSPYAATGLDLDGRAGIEWGVYGVPETFLVGPDGTVVYKKIGPLAPGDLEAEILPRVAALRLEAEHQAATTPPGETVERDDPATAEAAGAPLANLAWLDESRTLPDTPFILADGSEAYFSDYRGQAIVLNFWATWCPPCREEMPSLDRLAAAHGGNGLVVMPMSLDRGDSAKIVAFYEEIGAGNLGIYHDPTMSVSRALGVFGLPTTLLVDHDGRVVAQLVGTAEWDDAAALEAILPLAEAAVAASGGAQQAQAGD